MKASSTDGATALLSACGRGDVSTAPLLLEKGASVDVKSHAGVTPLQAIKGQQQKIRELLVRHGEKE
jgi:ankyrin repeat protein